MRLYDLMKSENILYEIQLNGKSFEFKAVIEDVIHQSVLASPVRIKGKVAGLSGDNVTVNVLYVKKGEPPLMWGNVTCRTVTYKGDMFYKLESEEEGIHVNRRDNFRLLVDVQCITKIMDDDKIAVSTLKDVSELGFSFVSDQKDLGELDGDQIVNVTFSDINHDVSFMGVIVRKVAYADNKVLYGCRIASTSQRLNRYINDKQRTQIAQACKES